MKRVIFPAPAEQEMVGAALFYELRAPRLGRRFLNQVAQAVRALNRNPKAWTEVRSGIRRKPVLAFPYALLYREDPQEIVILAVMHLHRDPAYWTERLY